MRSPSRCDNVDRNRRLSFDDNGVCSDNSGGGDSNCDDNEESYAARSWRFSLMVDCGDGDIGFIPGSLIYVLSFHICRAHLRQLFMEGVVAC